MNESMDAFIKFRNSLKSVKRLNNGDESFKGKIIYKIGGRAMEETLKVTLKLTTWESGQISIKEGAILRPGTAYLDFNYEYQDFIFTNEGYLLITGVGDLGEYEVKILQA